jgi:hypothetical protein
MDVFGTDPLVELVKAETQEDGFRITLESGKIWWPGTFVGTMSREVTAN